MAEELDNVAQACKMMGVSRDTFYRYKAAVDEGGVEALIDKNRRVANVKNRVDTEVESTVFEYAVEQPAHGQTPLQVVDDMDKAAEILQLFLDPDVPGSQPLAEVRTQALKLLPQERLSRWCQHLVHEAKVDALSYEWAALDSLMVKSKRNLRALVMFLELTGTKS